MFIRLFAFRYACFLRRTNRGHPVPADLIPSFGLLEEHTAFLDSFVRLETDSDRVKVWGYFCGCCHTKRGVRVRTARARREAVLSLQSKTRPPSAPQHAIRTPSGVKLAQGRSRASLLYIPKRPLTPYQHRRPHPLHFDPRYKRHRPGSRHQHPQHCLPRPGAQRRYGVSPRGRWR